MRTFCRKTAALAFLLLPIIGAVPLSGLNSSEPDFLFWLGLLGKEQASALDTLGNDYTEIRPEFLGSSADRILWFRNGLTLWIDGGRITQLRFDSSRSGEIAGISIGSSITDIVNVCGDPWIESDDSLYYNLPWQGGPARLRFIFAAGEEQDGLEEVYLYLVH